MMNLKIFLLGNKLTLILNLYHLWKSKFNVILTVDKANEDYIGNIGLVIV